MVEEDFENYLPHVAPKVAFELSTMVGEHFENYLPQVAESFI